jgi:peptide/nickel transport system substrate-binding protein
MDLGTASARRLTWTFKTKGTAKYEDGAEVKIEDYAYAIKRSFAHDVFANGPTYQLHYFKDGDKYKGPYAAAGLRRRGDPGHRHPDHPPRQAVRRTCRST